MNDPALQRLAASLVPATYVQQGAEARAVRVKQLKQLLASRALPARGLDDSSIGFVLQELAMLDSNNFTSNVGVGEREARVASSMVARRHYGMAHGIGRSGDIAAVQV